MTDQPGAWSVLQSPIDDLLLLTDGRVLTGIRFAPFELPARTPDDPDHPVLAGARRQLEEYFAGGRHDFDLPLDRPGTPFQQRVWDLLRSIPYGTTVSYGTLARRLGLALGASRAVGLANGANPLPVVVPCHRVIGADGSLTGYGGGLDRKRFLLTLERGGDGQTLF